MADETGSANAVARRAKNTLRERPFVPIILIPGILASRIESRQGSDRRKVWDPDSVGHMLKDHLFASSEHQRSLFASAGTRVIEDSNGYPVDQALRGWGEVHRGTYKSFLEACDTHRFRGFDTKVYVIGYNFFRSNQIACDRVIARVQDILDQEKLGARSPKGFLFVTHSMGSLAARAALRKSFTLSSECHGTVFVVPPNDGAVLFYRRFFTGATHDSFMVNIIFGNTKTKFATAASAIDSAFELLPTNAYAATDQKPREWLHWQVDVSPESMRSSVSPRLNRTPPTPDVYQTYADDDGPASLAGFVPELRESLLQAIRTRAKSAAGFHDWLRDFAPGPFGIVCSNGRETDTSVRVKCSVQVTQEKGKSWTQGSTQHTVPPTTRSEIVRSGEEVRTRVGDGTVPFASQIAFKDRATAVSQLEGAEHGPLLNEASVREKLFEMLDQVYAASTSKAKSK